ncbi:uncharacterized protein [Triticum aestivum]|uniref:uncharacterized protein isoform X2 n=1 Tax=Triticum aestivum TaxID=4565 RepID=UPI001D02FB43|nr:uncharacterized protein LOC123088066 isoform X2 [Triticum aestivum]
MSGRQRASAEGGSPHRRSHATQPIPHGHCWLLGMSPPSSLIIPYKNHEVCKLARISHIRGAREVPPERAQPVGQLASWWELLLLLTKNNTMSSCGDPPRAVGPTAEMHPKHKGLGNIQMLLHYKDNTGSSPSLIRFTYQR